LYGLENISAHNGWAISLVGITIVFTGLTLLSLAIDQLHKILNIWENKDKYLNNQNRKILTSPTITAPQNHSYLLKIWKPFANTN
jgi:hypothetical protein